MHYNYSLWYVVLSNLRAFFLFQRTAFVGFSRNILVSCICDFFCRGRIISLNLGKLSKSAHCFKIYISPCNFHQSLKITFQFQGLKTRNKDTRAELSKQIYLERIVVQTYTNKRVTRDNVWPDCQGCLLEY